VIQYAQPTPAFAGSAVSFCLQSSFGTSTLSCQLGPDGSVWRSLVSLAQSEPPQEIPRLIQRHSLPRLAGTAQPRSADPPVTSRPKGLPPRARPEDSVLITQGVHLCAHREKAGWFCRTPHGTGPSVIVQTSEATLVVGNDLVDPAQQPTSPHGGSWYLHHAMELEQISLPSVATLITCPRAALIFFWTRQSITYILTFVVIPSKNSSQANCRRPSGKQFVEQQYEASQIAFEL